MARLSDVDRNKKTNQAKDLYVKGFSLSFISETVSVKAETIKVWAKDGKWDRLKTSTTISADSIRQMLMKCAEDISKGDKPIASPDQLSKLVSAFEKLTDKDKRIASLYDAYSVLLDCIMLDAQNEKNEKKRQSLIDFAQKLLGFTDKVIKTAQDSNE